MLSLTRHICAAAILLGIVSISSTADSQTQAYKKERTGSVSGRVTINGKGAPGIVVSMLENESNRSQSRKDVTDKDGNYRIIGVPAGKYTVAPYAAAFVIADVDALTLWGKSVLIAEGETVEGFDFALLRGGVITGKVIDADGRPLIEETVNVISADRNDLAGFRRPYLPMGFQTDDRGIYRIFGLPPGRYVVSVGQSADSTSAYSDLSLHKQTFHPDVTDRAKATIIELTNGSEATDVDITVSGTLRVFSAKGRIVDGESGQPLANLQFELTKISGLSRSTTGSSNQRSNSQGEFRIDRLTPGQYAVSIAPPRESDLRADAVNFDIIDQDVTGLIIKASKVGGSLTGSVVLEGSQEQAEAGKFAEFYLTLWMTDERINYGKTTQVRADGSFSFTGFPSGLANFSLSKPQRDTKTNYAIVRVERDGVVQPTGIQLHKSEHASGVRIIVVASRTGSIRGAIRFVNGTLPVGSRLFVSLTKAGEPYSNSQPTDPDARGHFVIEGLPAGDYELSATAYVPGSQEAWHTAKQVVSVEEGAVAEVTLTFEIKQTPKPTSNQ